MRRSFLFLPLAFLFLTGCGPKDQAPSAPIVLWDWQPDTPLSISDRDLILEQRQIPFVLVKAGGVVLEDGKPRIERKLTRATLLSYGKVPLHLCYRPSLEFTRAFEGMDPVALGQWLGERFLDDALEAREAGAVVQGIQLDFDCPTRLLPQYRKMLSALRPELQREGSLLLSITAMETWLHHFSFRSLARETDFFMPILYGYDIPRESKDLPPLASRTRIRWAKRLSSLMGRSFWIGLPAYTAGFVYDEKGRFLSVENELFMDELSQSRNLQYEAFQREKGSDEVRHTFRVVRDLSWKGLELKAGWKIVAEEMTSSQLRNLLGDLGPAKGDFRGAALFHLDKVGGRSIPLSGLLALAGPRSPGHDLGLKADFLGEKEGDLTLAAILTNRDPYPSLMGYSPVRLEVRIKDGSFEDAASGDFERVEFFHGFQDKLEPSSQGRANVALFTKARLASLAQAKTGPLKVRRTGPQFAIYLYGSMDSTMLFKRLLIQDFEVYPRPVSPQLSFGGLKP